MSNRTYFFPLVANPFPLQEDYNAIYTAALRAINNLQRSWCPVCGRFVTDTEAHIANAAAGQCHRIVNIGIP